jgi:hypothetical protein
MSDLLKQGSDWLESQRTKFATREVVYRRGSATVNVLATIGRTLFELDNGYGVLEKAETRDYLILAADLILDTQLTLPQRGDKILETDQGRTYVYEVLAPGREPHWRYSDPYRRTLRIHTKHVETQT